MKTRAGLGMWMLFGLLAGLGCGPTQAGPGGTSVMALCSASNKCPAAQWCFNGLCAPGCNSNQDCASDQYCDTKDFQPYFCKNKTVARCPETPCASNQECRDGLCSAKPEPGVAACTPRSDFSDSCDKYAVCLDEDEQGPQPAACRAFPPCPEDGACPVGLGGAVCNEKYIPAKGRFCIPGACANKNHCPTDWFCIKQTSNLPLGFCSSGGPNMPCFQNTDCLSKSCFSPAPGFPGMCQ